MSFRHPLRAARLAALGLIAPLAFLAAPHAAYAVGTADGNIPIGTTTIPASEFGVYGGATVGSGYISTLAPTNGLLVQGNVGIGTTSPQNLLDVNGAASIGYNVAAPSNGLIVSGSVGIGTNAPNNPLVLYGTSGTFVTFQLANTQSAVNSGNQIRFVQNTADVGAIRSFITSISGGNSSAMTFWTVGAGTNAERVRIDNNGVLGIGTTTMSSSNKLEVNGAASIGYADTAAPTSGLIVSGQTGIGTAAPNAAALLDVFSTTQGLLPPRVTATQETAIGTNVSSGGLLVYNTTLNELDVYNSSTGQWEAVGANAADAAGSTGQVQFNSGGDLGASANFFWDNTHNRLGIGTAAPAAALDVYTSAGIGAIDLGGVNGISYPSTDSTAGASIAIGNGALTKEPSLASTAFQNTAIGYQAMSSASLGTAAVGNTATGYRALASNTTGSSNTASGQVALGLDTTGANNTAVGVSALYTNVSGSNNAAVGGNALFFSTGGGNAALGASALYYTTGSFNTAIGRNAGAGAFGSTFSNGVLLGYLAGQNLTTGNYNIVIDSNGATSGGITTGSSNISIGQGLTALSATGSNQLDIGNLIFATGLSSGGTISTGNVGIGTTSPLALLHVRGASSGQTYPTFASGGVLIEGSSISASNVQFETLTGSGVGLVAMGNGNVGIGTIAPLALLHVRAASSGQTYPTFAGGGVLIESASQNPSGVQFGTLTGSGPGLMVMGNGNVGIGTTAPQTTLQVVGSIMMGTGTCGITTAGSIQYSGGNVQYCNGSVWANIAGSGGAVTGSGTTNYVARWTSPTALGTGVLYDNGSVVGIGTTTPVATLDVNGYAHLAKNASQPIACDAAHDGSLALASTRRPCECVGSAWIDVVYGTACSW